MSVPDQSRDLVLSNFISVIWRIQNVNKKQPHWHLWYDKCFFPPLVSHSAVLTSTVVSRRHANTEKVAILWKAVTSKRWSMALIGLKQRDEIDPIGDIVTGDLQTR